MDQRKFENLLVDLSAAFINLSPDQVDAEIQNAQRSVCESLGLDRSTVWQFLDPDLRIMVLTHLHHQPQNGPAPDREDSLERNWKIQMPEGPPGFAYLEANKCFPWATSLLRDNQTVIFSRLDDLPEEASVDKMHLRHYGTKSSVMVPLAEGGRVLGAIAFAMLLEEIEWPESLVTRIHAVARIFSHAIARKRMDLERKRMEQELQARLTEITDLKKQIERENIYLKEEYDFLNGYCDIVGQSSVIQKVFQQIEQVAPTDSHVLITGETGTGKELVARAIHAASRRKERILVKVNCATLSPSLIESELFGREKGAYTGALTRQIGRFELADGGTIFLDEIGELSVELQSKLLRVLQDGEFERLGAPQTMRVNVRVIAATNRNLTDAVYKDAFRKDLYYRLSVFPIHVPPLRARVDDIPLLVWAFIGHFSRRMGKNIKSVPQKTMEHLKNYAWPGNIRELRNTIEYAMILSQGGRLEVQLPEGSRMADAPVLTLKEAEQHQISEALRQAEGHIKGPRGAAALLGLKPSTLYTKMEKLGIKPHPIQDAKPS